MGWTSHPGERRPTDKVLREVFTSAGHKIIVAAIRDDVWYAAVQPKGEAIVTALVVEFDRTHGAFSYKVQDERQGPVAAKAPVDVLNALTPIEEIADPGFAALWRATCRGQVRNVNNWNVYPMTCRGTVQFVVDGWVRDRFGITRKVDVFATERDAMWLATSPTNHSAKAGVAR